MLLSTNFRHFRTLRPRNGRQYCDQRGLGVSAVAKLTQSFFVLFCVLAILFQALIPAYHGPHQLSSAHQLSSENDSRLGSIADGKHGVLVAKSLGSSHGASCLLCAATLLLHSSIQTQLFSLPVPLGNTSLLAITSDDLVERILPLSQRVRAPPRFIS